MIPVVFYECTADNRVVDKTNFLLRQDTKKCDFFNQTGVMHPSILLFYDSNIINNCNYFYIAEWGRWYYITGIEVMPGGRMVVTGSEDVLYSNKDEILNLDAYVIRTETESRSNKLINDAKHPIQSNRCCNTVKWQTPRFNATANDPVYLLTVVGGDAPT